MEGKLPLLGESTGPLIQATLHDSINPWMIKIERKPNSCDDNIIINKDGRN